MLASRRYEVGVVLGSVALWGAVTLFGFTLEGRTDDRAPHNCFGDCL